MHLAKSEIKCVSLRDESAQKREVTPTMLVAGFFLSATDGHGVPYLALEGNMIHHERNEKILVKILRRV